MMAKRAVGTGKRCQGAVRRARRGGERHHLGSAGSAAAPREPLGTALPRPPRGPAMPIARTLLTTAVLAAALAAPAAALAGAGAGQSADYLTTLHAPARTPVAIHGD